MEALQFTYPADTDYIRSFYTYYLVIDILECHQRQKTRRKTKPGKVLICFTWQMLSDGDNAQLLESSRNVAHVLKFLMFADNILHNVSINTSVDVLKSGVGLSFHQAGLLQQMADDVH